MINFEEELSRFAPIPEVSQAEEAIYNNDLRDISDIVSQITSEIKDVQMSMQSPMAGRIRR